MKTYNEYLRIISTAFLLIVIISSCQKKPQLSPEEAKEIAKKVYIYGFPMAMNYKTIYLYSVDKNSPEYKGGFNYLSCQARVYTPDDKAIVTPNSDTPYCMMIGDLGAEPIVITVPKIEDDRFYQIQLVDAFTHNFAYISSIEQGNVAGSYLIAGPDWKGEKPKEISEVIPCETELIFAVIRTQLFNPEDLPNVKAIQDSYRLQTLSDFLGTEAPKPDAQMDFPVWHEGAQFNDSSFIYIDFMLKQVSTPPEENELMTEFKKIGLGTDKPFSLSEFSPEIRSALEEGVNDAKIELKAFINKYSSDPSFSGKVFGTRAFLEKSAKELGLQDFYMMRMAAAQIGLYGNSAKEAMYPIYRMDSDGNPLTGENKYKVTFDKGKLPPASAFWSLTMYDGKTQLLVANPINRYLLNSPMLNQFVYGDDGSLTLYIQKNSPGEALENNWLPAPDGPFYVVLRLYGPSEAALNGEWIVPPMVKTD